MILADPNSDASPAALGNRASLDELLRRAAARRPNEIALVDPPNRAGFSDGTPRRLTYAEVDRIVSAIAGRLSRIGLHADAIVGLQFPNIVEGALTLLAAWRAGLIAMPLPLLWRRADAVAALGRVGANALIVAGRVGDSDHFDLARNVAAEIFPIRFVCGFGRDPPDGVIPLDDVFTTDTPDPAPALDPERVANAGRHLALITWDVAHDGLVPVARSHAELIAGGLTILLESRLPQDAVLLSTLALSSFAGLATGLVPWLLSGGTLALHHAFDVSAFASQQRQLQPETLVVPGPLASLLAEASLIAEDSELTRVLAVWRAPEKLPRAPTWRATEIALVDVQVFGETGLVAARRGAGGRPGGIPFGAMFAPRGVEGAMAVGEIQATAAGTVAMRGPMVPRAAFPPRAERSHLPHFKVDPNGFVDTGFACRTGDEIPVPVVTGPPPGIVSVGGYRFVAHDLQAEVADADLGGTLAILPHALAGHQLAGTAPDRDAIRAALTKRGVNPLLAGAFRERKRSVA